VRFSYGFSILTPNASRVVTTLPLLPHCPCRSDVQRACRLERTHFWAPSIRQHRTHFFICAVSSSSARQSMAAFEPYPHELWHLKCLLLHRQYHQCIKASNDILGSRDEGGDSHSLFDVFATFYLAMSHDELARLMHEHSAFKLTYFERAEQHYHQAINLLPSLEQCRNIVTHQHQKGVNGEDAPSSPLENGLLSPVPSATSHTAQALFAEVSDSDSDSNDSFDDFSGSEAPRITLPRPTLERDYSSMSLLDVRPRLTKSTSQGLLRPIRLGSPPKAHHLPPKLPYFGKDHSSQPSRSPSPLPQTPVITVVTPPIEQTLVAEEQCMDFTRLSEHLNGMRKQIYTHINLLRRAKLATTVAQAARASRAQAPALAPQKRILKSKSFWSFTPADVKMAEKERKIGEGRARGWARKRYDPGKHEALVENALAEL
jgi:hypothetical protein